MMTEEQNQTTKKLNIWMPLMLSAVMVLGMIIGIKMQPTPPTVSIVNPNEGLASNSLGQGKLEELIRYIEAKYVDDVDREKMVQEAIDNILKQLDPHSNYISASQLQEVNEQLEGNFDGIGIEFMMLDDTILVVRPLEGGPSEAAGIIAGDKLIEIEDSLVAGVNIDSDGIMELLRGERESEVQISVLRKGEPNLKIFSVKRDKIPVNSVDVAYMVDEETGYIKINRFSATTYEEFMDNMKELTDDNTVKNLVIDLRQNPGGYLQEATNILSQLFDEKDKLLVYTEGRAVNRNDYETSGRNLYNFEDIVVLIDEGSASASEIMAGAIQDWDRGRLVGRRSFGKGLVQEQYPLNDGSALRLTVARYYTPSGRSIQKDYDDKDAYNHDVFNRFKNGEMYNQDSIDVVDTTEFRTSEGRLVYGGGGITPDIFVPLDSNLITDHYIQLRQHIPPFVYRYLEKNKATFEDMSFESFVNDYKVSDKLLYEFKAYAQSKDITTNNTKWRKAKTQVARFMKARIGKHMFDDKGFFAAWNQEDEIMEEALKALKQEKPLVQKYGN